MMRGHEKSATYAEPARRRLGRQILRGAKPAYLRVKQPTKFDLVVNLMVAKTLGLEVPPMVLARAKRGDRMT